MKNYCVGFLNLRDNQSILITRDRVLRKRELLNLVNIYHLYTKAQVTQLIKI